MKNGFFIHEYLEPRKHHVHGDTTGRNSAQTPQHPNMIHIPSRLFSSLYVAQMNATLRSMGIPHYAFQTMDMWWCRWKISWRRVYTLLSFNKIGLNHKNIIIQHFDGWKISFNTPRMNPNFNVNVHIGWRAKIFFTRVPLYICILRPERLCGY